MPHGAAPARESQEYRDRDEEVEVEVKVSPPFHTKRRSSRPTRDQLLYLKKKTKKKTNIQS